LKTKKSFSVNLVLALFVFRVLALGAVFRAVGAGGLEAVK
jgi:hypothetical protein